MNLTTNSPEYFLYNVESIIKGNPELSFNGQLLNRGLGKCGLIVGKKETDVNLPESNLVDKFSHNTRATNEDEKTRLTTITILNNNTLLISALSTNNQHFYEDLSGQYIGFFQLFEGRDKYKQIYSWMCSSGIGQAIPDDLLKNFPKENQLELCLKKQ